MYFAISGIPQGPQAGRPLPIAA